MSIFFSGNSNSTPFNLEDDVSCTAAASFICLSIKNVFSVSLPEPALTYQRKVLLVSRMIRSSFEQRLEILENLGWQIEYDNEVAAHPKGQIYQFAELTSLLDQKLANIMKVTCLFAATIGYRYDADDGLFKNGEDVVSLETIGTWVKGAGSYKY